MQVTLIPTRTSTPNQDSEPALPPRAIPTRLQIKPENQFQQIQQHVARIMIPELSGPPQRLVHPHGGEFSSPFPLHLGHTKVGLNRSRIAAVTLTLPSADNRRIHRGGRIEEDILHPALRGIRIDRDVFQTGVNVLSVAGENVNRISGFVFAFVAAATAERGEREMGDRCFVPDIRRERRIVSEIVEPVFERVSFGKVHLELDVI